MKYTTITIGGGNKNFFFSKCCLELLIINCLKNRNVNILSKINITGTVQVLVAHSVPNNNENNSPEEIKNLVKFKPLTLFLNITTNKFMKSINIGIEII